MEYLDTEANLQQVKRHLTQIMKSLSYYGKVDYQDPDLNVTLQQALSSVIFAFGKVEFKLMQIKENSTVEEQVSVEADNAEQVSVEADQIQELPLNWADCSFISAVVRDDGEEKAVTQIVENAESPVKKDSDEWVSKKKRMNSVQRYDKMTIDELLELDMSKIPEMMINRNEKIVAHEKFNMFVKDGSPFIHSRTHGGIFIGSGGWMLNKDNGFIYMQTDPSKPPHPSFFMGKFWKWNMENFVKNPETFSFEEDGENLGNHYSTIQDFITA